MKRSAIRGKVAAENGAFNPFGAVCGRLEHAVTNRQDSRLAQPQAARRASHMDVASESSLYARAFDRHGWRECTHCRSKCTPSMKCTVREVAPGPKLTAVPLKVC